MLVLGILAGPQTVAADTELGETGTVGAHSLNDTTANPGATCKYHYISAQDGGRLNRIDVDPPNVKAVAGKSSQSVGWQFTVQRRAGSIYTNNPWKNRYTSPIKKALTDDAHNAPFSGGTVSVTVPYGPDSQDVQADYRVVVKMLWYLPNGAVQGTARHRVNYYDTTENNASLAVQHNLCWSYWY
jgi:hypothetical protein